jgi:hypothetical protein
MLLGGLKHGLSAHQLGVSGFVRGGYGTWDVCGKGLAAVLYIGLLAVVDYPLMVLYLSAVSAVSAGPFHTIHPTYACCVWARN